MLDAKPPPIQHTSAGTLIFLQSDRFFGEFGSKSLHPYVIYATRMKSLVPLVFGFVFNIFHPLFLNLSVNIN